MKNERKKNKKYREIVNPIHDCRYIIVQNNVSHAFDIMKLHASELYWRAVVWSIIIELGIKCMLHGILTHSLYDFIFFFIFHFWYFVPFCGWSVENITGWIHSMPHAYNTTTMMEKRDLIDKNNSIKNNINNNTKTKWPEKREKEWENVKTNAK